jgi:hypothetical protein
MYIKQMTGEIPWWNDPAILFNKEHLLNFFPNPDAPISTAYNAIVRFTIYGAVILFAVSRNTNYLIAIPIVLLLTYLLYQVSPPKEHMMSLKEQYLSYTGTKPTPNNPLMNVQVHEYSTNPNRDKASNSTNPQVKAEITDNLYAGSQVMDLAEARDKKFFERQFITTANTSVPNNQENFSKFLMKDVFKAPKIAFEGQLALPGGTH